MICHPWIHLYGFSFHCFHTELESKSRCLVILSTQSKLPVKATLWLFIRKALGSSWGTPLGMSVRVFPKRVNWKGDCPGGAQHHLIDWRLRPTQLEKGGKRKSAECQHPPLYFLLHGDLRKPQGQFQPIQSQLLSLLCHDRLYPLKPWANIKPSCLKLLCQSVSALRRVTDRTPTSLHIHRDRKDNVPNTLLDITHISPGHSHSEHDAWC